IGDLWVVCESQGRMPDRNPVTMMMTLGYDSKKKRFVGTWLGSMMDYLWVYDGALDESGKALVLETEGPGPDGKNMIAKEVIEIKSENERVFTSHMRGEDGEWKLLMTTTYKRKGEKQVRSEEHTSELQSRENLVCRHLL